MTRSDMSAREIAATLTEPTALDALRNRTPPTPATRRGFACMRIYRTAWSLMASASSGASVEP